MTDLEQATPRRAIRAGVAVARLQPQAAALRGGRVVRAGILGLLAILLIL